MTIFNLQPSEIARSIGGGLIGTITAGVGYSQGNFWAVLIGSAIGAGSVAWTFGIWLRDRSFEFLRLQNRELFEELRQLRAEISTQRCQATCHTMPAADLGHPHSEGS